LPRWIHFHGISKLTGSRTWILVLYIFSASGALHSAGCREQGESEARESSEQDKVLAEVGGRRITQAEVRARLSSTSLSAGLAGQGSAGQSRAVRQLVEEEMLYRAALDEGLAKDQEIRDRVSTYERQLLVQTYLDRKQAEASRVSEEEARRFYEEHRDDYTTERAVRVRMLLNPKRIIVERAVEMVASGTLKFEIACGRFTEHPQLQAALGLFPTWILENRALTWLGNHPKFHEVAASLEPNVVSEVFELPQGFAVIRIEEVREPALRPFEEVRGDVEGRIARERTTKGLPALLDSLEERYHVKFHEPSRSADELFTAAQEARNPQERVKLYEELVERYPDHARAVESWFMIGFIRTEELQDDEGAKLAFEKVIELGSDSELAQSARWMLTSGKDDVPVFDGEPGKTLSEEHTP
jgi:peptidyl-prolyl cis-trans isomerase C